MKDARIYLIHIRECLTRIENYTQNGQNDFMNNILIRHWYRLARSYKRCNTRGSTNQANLE
jgi:uncharacterized protein with HEPN domain